MRPVERIGPARRRRLRNATLIAVTWLAAGHALAGGPLAVRSNGQPYLWPAGVITYQTDGGPLSPMVSEAAIQARVVASFDVWQAVSTSSIAYARGGPISATGAFSDGDVSTAVEYAAVEASCDNSVQNPVVYDADGTILRDLGFDTTRVLGVAGPCALSASNITSGFVILNGLLQDQPPPADPSAAAFDAAIIHEIGHFSGLDHSQINVNCTSSCVGDELAGLPTMFPNLIHFSQGQLAVDDIAWISRLYPAASFATTHGAISGVVFFTDGESHAQLVNVIARPLDGGLNLDRTSAASVISGYKFRAIHGNPLTGAPPSNFGSTAAGDIGLFEIPVPAGTYTIEVESIHPSFTGGSRVGEFRIAMPGSAPAPLGPIIVSAGMTVSGNDVILQNTPPRFDQFEGP